MHPASLSSDELLKDCTFRTTRRKGPGGQHRNKVETAVIIQHQPSGIIAEANEKRSQAENRKEAIFRLRLALAVQVRTAETPGPSELMKSRLKAGKIAVNPRHAEFPILLAECLDRLESHHYQVPDTAAEMGLSGSQLVKFLKLHPPAYERFNQAREERNLPRLKF